MAAHPVPGADQHATLSDIAAEAGVTRAAVSAWRRRYSDFPSALTERGTTVIVDRDRTLAWVAAKRAGGVLKIPKKQFHSDCAGRAEFTPSQPYSDPHGANLQVSGGPDTVTIAVTAPDGNEHAVELTDAADLDGLIIALDALRPALRHP